MIDYNYYEDKYGHLPLRDANNFHTSCPWGWSIADDGNHATMYNRQTWKYYRKTQYVDKTPKVPKKRKCSTKEHWRSKGMHSNYHTPYVWLTTKQRKERDLLRMEYYFNTYEQGQWLLRSSSYWRINKVSDKFVTLDDGYDYTPRDILYWNFGIGSYDYVTGCPRKDYETGEWEGYKYFKAVA